MTRKTHPTLAILAIRGFAISNSRRPLISRMREAGWNVLLFTSDDDDARQVESLGATLVPIAFSRGGLALFRDLRALVQLIRLFRKYKPDLVHLFHAKPILLGTIAISLIPGWQPKIVSTITGLGYAFAEVGMNWFLASHGYQRLMKRSDATIFQNQDDHDLFIDRKWVTEPKAHLISSSGVDTARFRPREEGNGSTTVLMVARLIVQKGVLEYLEAAKILREKHSNTVFLLAGELEPSHPDGIPESTIMNMSADAGVQFLGFVTRIEELLPTISVFVFPSYYREGLPRVVIEAAACGVPTVGADAPGTRDAIQDGVTGVLVPPKNSRLLSQRIGELLNDEKLRAQMGIAARRKVVAEFDINAITSAQVAVYQSVLPFAEGEIEST